MQRDGRHDNIAGLCEHAAYFCLLYPSCSVSFFLKNQAEQKLVHGNMYLKKNRVSENIQKTLSRAQG